jgi:hypothetical protein
MNDENLYYNVVQSLVKFIQDFREEVQPNSGYFDFDAHAQQSELPAGILMGPAGTALTYEEQGMSVVFSFGIITDQDPNLFQLRRMVSTLLGRLKPETKIPVYDAETGTIISWMVVTPPVAATPVTQIEIRSCQFVMVHAQVNPAATSTLAA